MSSKEYRKYDTWGFQHGQHYYIQNEYLKDPKNSKVNTYTKEGFPRWRERPRSCP